MIAMKQLLIMIIFLGSMNHALASDNYLYGTLKAYTPYGKQEPMAGVKVSVLYNDKIFSTTDYQGRFRLDIGLDNRLKAGKKIVLKIDEPSWLMLSPFKGELFIPYNLENYELNIKLVTNRSRLQIDGFTASFAGKDNNGVEINQVYLVQVLTSTSRDAAFTTKDFFVQKGFKTYIQVTKSFNDIVYYKVLVGNYLTKNKANIAKNRIRKTYKKYKDSFVKLVAK